MPAISTDVRLLALELIVRRLAQRVTRNHPRALDDLEHDLAMASPHSCSSYDLTQHLQTYSYRSRTR